MENPVCLVPFRHVNVALKSFGERGAIFVDFPHASLFTEMLNPYLPKTNILNLPKYYILSSKKKPVLSDNIRIGKQMSEVCGPIGLKEQSGSILTDLTV